MGIKCKILKHKWRYVSEPTIIQIFPRLVFICIRNGCYEKRDANYDTSVLIKTKRG